MSDTGHGHLMWAENGGRVVAFSTAGRAGKTTVKIEMEFTDGWALADFMRHLQDAQKPRTPPKRPERT